ncbi:MAG: carbohydrate ABC transporter substrate-binding protein [Alphaproteobacteria bacterium]|nr:carbohydrate ABC transporter substrate-binding protein [Alphaproteobacteria bacterium]
MLSRPFVANAAAKTATVWWIQGFAQEEDIAFKKIVDDYEKASGNKIDYTIAPYAPMRQKTVAAITSGDVPDLFQNSPTEMNAVWAWDDKLVDLGDVVETQKAEYTEAALLSANCYNSVTKKRSYYLAPYQTASLPNHIWRPLVEKAGYKMEDIPKTWDAYYGFFKDVQKKLREQGMRNVYGLGFQLTTQGNDPNNFFGYWLLAYGGGNLVDKSGKLHLDDPKVKEAVVKTIEVPTTFYKEGFVPQSAINWNDADDNNAFHAKQIVMDLDGTISTEVAIIKNKEDYDDIVVQGLPLSNDGKPVPAQVTNGGGMIPRGAKNVEVAKDFLKYLIQPKVTNEYLKIGMGRNVPAFASIVKNDSWWTEDPHRKAYVEQALLGPTEPDFFVYNPAWAEVRNQHVFGAAWADVLKNGMTPQAATEKAFKWVEQIFAKYPIEST